MLTMRVCRKFVDVCAEVGETFPFIQPMILDSGIVGEIVCGQHTTINVRHQAISQGAELRNFANSDVFFLFRHQFSNDFPDFFFIYLIHIIVIIFAFVWRNYTLVNSTVFAIMVEECVPSRFFRNGK